MNFKIDGFCNYLVCHVIDFLLIMMIRLKSELALYIFFVPDDKLCIYIFSVYTFKKIEHRSPESLR